MINFFKKASMFFKNIIYIKITLKNFYLLNLLIILLGVVAFISNSKYIINYPMLLFFSIILMIFPSLFIIFYCDCNKINRYFSLFIVLFPLIFIYYIYYLTQGIPVGMQDPHDHIYRTLTFLSESNKISFSNAQFNTASANFVGLYIIYDFLIKISQFSAVFLASIIPPFMNILLILIVYIIVNRLHSHKVALLAVILYGWEEIVIILGQEIRTQTLGTILLFSLLASLIINNKDGRNFKFSIIIFLFIFGIIISSFTSIVFSFLILLSMFLTLNILKIFKKNVRNLQPKGIYLIFFLIIYIAYLLYIGISFTSIFLNTQILLINFLKPIGAMGDTIINNKTFALFDSYRRND
jgi:hypothetical protein